jgi:hypothetical protein
MEIKMSFSYGTMKVLENTAAKLSSQGQKAFWDRIKKAKDFKEIFGIICEIEESLAE